MTTFRESLTATIAEWWCDALDEWRDYDGDPYEAGFDDITGFRLARIAERLTEHFQHAGWRRSDGSLTGWLPSGRENQAREFASGTVPVYVWKGNTP